MKKKQNNLCPISYRIWQMRRESGLTIEKLIEISGLSNGWWHRLNGATKAPTDTTIEKIAKNLVIDEQWIREGGPEPDWDEFRELMKQMTTKYRNVLRETKARYGVEPGTMAIMTKVGDPPPVRIKKSVQEMAGEFAQLLGVKRHRVLDMVAELIRETQTKEDEK